MKQIRIRVRSKMIFQGFLLLGHGTRERLSQSEGEIYRDVV